jgi:hypothetical protein
VSTIEITIENLTSLIFPACDQLIHTQRIQYLLPLRKHTASCYAGVHVYEERVTGHPHACAAPSEILKTCRFCARKQTLR